MLVTGFHVAIAERRAAEARRYVDRSREAILKLRASGRDSAANEKSLETMESTLRQFDAFVRSMRLSLGDQAPGSRAAQDLAQRIARLRGHRSEMELPPVKVPAEIAGRSEMRPRT